MTGPKLYLQISKIGPAPLWGTTSGRHGLAEKSQFLGVLRQPPRDPWAVVGRSFGDNGGASQPIVSHEAPIRPKTVGTICTVVRQSYLAYSRHCASIQAQACGTFFFHMDPLTNDGSRVLSLGFQDQPLYGAPLVRT